MGNVKTTWDTLSHIATISYKLTLSLSQIQCLGVQSFLSLALGSVRASGVSLPRLHSGLCLLDNVDQGQLCSIILHPLPQTRGRA